MDLESLDSNFMVLVVPIQPLVGGGKPFRQELHIMSKGLQTDLNASNTGLQPIEPPLQPIEPPLKGIEPPLEGIEPLIDPSEFVGKKGNEFRVLVSRHQCFDWVKVLQKKR